MSLYCDDSATAKGLPMNDRASALCVACGRPTRIMGDVFLARAQDDSRDLYQRLDLKIADFSPMADWVKQAALAASSKQQSGSVQATAAPSTQRLKAYLKELELWVATKLSDFDSDRAVSKKMSKKHGDRQGYEAFLKGKVAAKMASYGLGEGQ